MNPGFAHVDVDVYVETNVKVGNGYPININCMNINPVNTFMGRPSGACGNGRGS